MATDRQLIEALRKAAENLLGRRMTQDEADDLVDQFNRATGTYRERAQKAIQGKTGLTQNQIGIRKSASDNTDRIMTDLENTLDEWKPGT